MLPSFSVASTKRCKDAGSAHMRHMGATEDEAARRVIAGEKPEDICWRGTWSENETRPERGAAATSGYPRCPAALVAYPALAASFATTDRSSAAGSGREMAMKMIATS